MARRPVRHTASRYVREELKRLLVRSSRLFCTPLDRQQTRSLPFLEQVYSTGPFELGSLRVNGELWPVSDQVALAYPQTALFRAACKQDNALVILPSGGICSGDRLLDNGFRQDYNILGYLQSLRMRKEPLAGTVIAPWPHRFLTYGDFVLQLLPELCLVKSVLDPEDWQNARFCLPRPPRFLVDYLVLLGCAPGQIVDSTRHTFRLQTGSRVYFREKDPMWWMCAPPDLIQVTRDYLMPSSLTTEGRISLNRRPNSLLHASRQEQAQGDLLFVERRGGYRNAIGLDKEVMLRLEGMGVKFFDGATLGVAEQIKAFSKARLVAGVHGAGIANTMWCRPGAKVIELFHPNYAPPFYAILAHNVGIDYYCLGTEPGQLDIRFRESDVAVDWSQLISLVAHLLKGS